VNKLVLAISLLWALYKSRVYDMIVGLYSTDQRKVITSGIPLNNLRIELNLKVN